MNKDLEIDIASLSKGQFQELAKDLLASDRVRVEPFTKFSEKFWTVGTGASNHKDILMPVDNQIWYVQKIWVRGGYYIDNGYQEKYENVTVSATLNGTITAQDQHLYVNGVGLSEGFIANYLRLFGDDGDVANLEESDMVGSKGSYAIIGWKATLY
ncbi:hypothetical protein [Carboxylicivirga sp. M1479]|uniref:hypothetical protein n=1 Tax=Carboxylicivirga sp. M1479 TaxID=2594476 RepID=UPI0011787962|nr:hypothetical protein [Carboxylicivirga sp. M1479]TRX70522.1 hypothetical protein FNN09_11125 [Carboxylicivirga sp. M1479]